MAQPAQSNFRFFDLPRELRDKVYLMIGTKIAKHRPRSFIVPCVVSVVGAPIPSMRRVSKQFTEEYDEEIKLHGHRSSLKICMRDHYQSLYGSKQSNRCVAFMRHAEEVEDLELEYYAVGWFTEDDEETIESDVRTIKQDLPNIKRVQVITVTTARDWTRGYTATYTSFDYFRFSRLNIPEEPDFITKRELRMVGNLYSPISVPGAAKPGCRSRRPLGSITYAAVPAAESQPAEHSFYGLDLQTIDCDMSIDYVEGAFTKK